MIYILSPSNKPDYNIALEAYCFKELRQFAKIFILWINEPAIIVGRNQNTQAEINSRYVAEHGIHVVRRITGGGAVYHDLNNLNYTIISNRETIPPYEGGEGRRRQFNKQTDNYTTPLNEGEERKAFDFETFSLPVIKTLAELGVKAEFSGRNDITIDGKKICGNAQAYHRGRVMHHGCLLFNTDLNVLSHALESPREVVEAKGVKSVRSRVANILPFLPEKITIEQFAYKLLAQMKRLYPEMKEYHFSDEEQSAIEKVRRNRFGNWNWNFGINPTAEIVRESRYPAGKIQVFLDTRQGVIQRISFFGTFFGKNSDLSAVEERLSGVKYNASEVRKALSSLDFSSYFMGFTLEELTDAIVDAVS